MRAAVLGLIAVLAATGVAEARDCSGQGSDRVLTFDDWALSSHGKSQVEVRYRLDDQGVTRLQGHVYFQIAPDAVLADAAIALENPEGVPAGGMAPLTLAKDDARRLANADHASVSVFACTNYIEYLDGKSLTID